MSTSDQENSYTEDNIQSTLTHEISDEGTLSIEAENSRITAQQTHADSAEHKNSMKWYVVHAYSGFELKAKQTLEERIRTYKLTEQFGDIYVPQETVVELVKGKKKTSNRKFFPGYILVQMVMNEDTWHLVKETPKVTGFLGDATNPSPLSEDEVKRILSQVEEGSSSPRSKVTFDKGDPVKVIDGAFAEFSGTVEEVKPEKGKLKVMISIFGRSTPVELDFIQVEKISG
jgi:transcription termination/antitermination protein NusG